MRCPALLSLLIFLGLAWRPAAVSAQPGTSGGSLAALLKASRWQQRVLLLCAPTATDAALLRQRQLLEPARADLAARDLLVREVLFTQLSAADKIYLKETLGVPAAGFTVLLVGKDGGVKRRETAPLAPAVLFSTIDQMPMRQQEMRRAKRL